jgi:formylglycine-generating enzyme required for sulfatase activity
MAGNVWQWCLNAYEQPSDISLESSVSRVLHGGCWYGYPGGCRSARRYGGGRDLRNYGIGFRLCCSSPIE